MTGDVTRARAHVLTRYLKEARWWTSPASIPCILATRSSARPWALGRCIAHRTWSWHNPTAELARTLPQTGAIGGRCNDKSHRRLSTSIVLVREAPATRLPPQALPRSNSSAASWCEKPLLPSAHTPNGKPNTPPTGYHARVLLALEKEGCAVSTTLIARRDPLRTVSHDGAGMVSSQHYRTGCHVQLTSRLEASAGTPLLHGRWLRYEEDGGTDEAEEQRPDHHQRLAVHGLQGWAGAQKLNFNFDLVFFSLRAV